MSQDYKFETLQIHAGQEPAAGTNARAVPIFSSTSYTFNDTDHAANLFALKEFGNIYSRLTNPTVGTLENRLTELEDGAMCVALSSGTSSVMYSLINIMSQGDNFITKHFR